MMQAKLRNVRNTREEARGIRTDYVLWQVRVGSVIQTPNLVVSPGVSFAVRKYLSENARRPVSIPIGKARRPEAARNLEGGKEARRERSDRRADGCGGRESPPGAKRPARRVKAVGRPTGRPAERPGGANAPSHRMSRSRTCTDGTTRSPGWVTSSPAREVVGGGE